MREPTESVHAALLNALDAMQESPAYALRRATLRHAETLILTQERQIAALKACLNALLDNATVYHSAIEIDVHNKVGFDAEDWEEQAMGLLGRTEKGANA